MTKYFIASLRLFRYDPKRQLRVAGCATTSSTRTPASNGKLCLNRYIAFESKPALLPQPLHRIWIEVGLFL